MNQKKQTNWLSAGSAMKGGLLLVGLLSLAPFATGCLILADAPTNELGEECKTHDHCDATAYCEPALKICLPRETQCTQTVSANCGGATCNTDYGYCEPGCGGDYDCVTGFVCQQEDILEDGVCVADPTASCSDLDEIRCGGYLCSFGNECDDRCYNNNDCREGYLCNADGQCTPGTAAGAPGDQPVDEPTGPDPNNGCAAAQCGAYACAYGVCDTYCFDEGDCATGYICSSSGECI